MARAPPDDARAVIRYRQQSSADGLSSAVLGNVIIVLSMAPLALSGPAPTTADVLAIAYLGVIQQAAAVFLFIRGVATVSALEAALLTLLEPMMSPVWAFILVHERPGLLAVLGAALILLATVARTIAAQRRPAPAA